MTDAVAAQARLTRDEIVAQLLEAGARPCDGDYPVVVEEIGTSANAEQARAKAAAEDPLVSCLMVTRGDPAQVAFAAGCYARQTWANRELVVITEPDAVDAVAQALRASGAPNWAVSAVAAGLALGDLRNAAIARARGDILMQWDDDDLYDPLRIALSVSVLLRSGAAAALMARWLIWWPARRLAALSERRLWEGTLTVWRAHAPVYPAVRIQEDWIAVARLRDTRRLVLFDAPLQYVYAVHGRNTWGEAHFAQMLDKAERVFEGPAYAALNRLLAERMPVLDYEAYLLGR